ncbi:MAG: permease [Desulfobacter sp.]|nr:MAG: permease [Desulfobacter sp.]
MAAVMKRYRFAMALLALNAGLVLVFPDKGIAAFSIEWNAVLDLITFIPPIFILLGLLDVWVEREKLMPHMGPGSGIRGAVLAYVMGSAAAGPLYIAFPIAGVLLKKGASLINIFIFIGAWSTTKLPMILFEASSIGLKYTLIRLAVNSMGIILIAVVLDKTTPRSVQERLYRSGRP